MLSRLRNLVTTIRPRSDQKDPKVIAMLVKERCFSYPYVPAGVYADIRILNNERLRSSKKIIICKKQIERWISIYFPEYKTVFKNVEAASSIIVLKAACLPSEVVSMGAGKINECGVQQI